MWRWASRRVAGPLRRLIAAGFPMLRHLRRDDHAGRPAADGMA